jgi:glycerol-3-phosphate dehydrogenase (NAD(P)+)
MRIAILGGGNWGTTLALLLNKSGHQIRLWEFDEPQAELVAQTRKNERYLPGYPIPEAIFVTSQIHDAMQGAEICILAIPTQVCRSVLKSINKLTGRMIVLSLIKGIEQSSLHRVSEICQEELEDFDLKNYCTLSGPTIAPEVASGLPTSAVVASKSPETAELIQKAFSTSAMRLYTSEDIVGVEMAGALKNVMALAAGISDGMQLGYNTKGALLTRGLAEISRLGEALGGKRQTFSGLSGIGDLITTCTSPVSRNRTVGERIGRGETLQQILNEMVMVAEGVWTARAARELAKQNNVNVPITDAVCQVLFEGVPQKSALNNLMTRDLKVED